MADKQPKSEWADSNQTKTSKELLAEHINLLRLNSFAVYKYMGLGASSNASAVLRENSAMLMRLLEAYANNSSSGERLNAVVKGLLDPEKALAAEEDDE